MATKTISLFDLAPGKVVLERYTIHRANRQNGRRASKSGANGIVTVDGHVDIAKPRAADGSFNESLVPYRLVAYRLVAYRLVAPGRLVGECGRREPVDGHIADESAFAVTVGRNVGPAAAEVDAGRGFC
jgi:hypothetical protein